MAVMYAILTVYVTKRNDIIKRLSNVITIWHTSAIEVTTLLKVLIQKWKVCKKKNLSWVWGGDRKIRPPGLQSSITQQILWCQTVTIGRDFSIYPLPPMINSYNIWTDITIPVKKWNNSFLLPVHEPSNCWMSGKLCRPWSDTVCSGLSVPKS